MKRAVLVTVGVGTFMSALDGSVVNTLLPVLARELHTNVAGIEWVTTTYLLVISALLLSVGRAGDLWGHRPIYVAGFGLFVVGSALSGASRSAHMLVGMRAIQGLGAAMVMASSPAILTRSVPAGERGKALGLLGTFTYLGLTAGPSLGGWLAGAYGWRYVFFINVPIGLLAIGLALRNVAHDVPAPHEERFDVPGAAVFTVGLVTLLIALNQGHAWGWRSAPIVALFAGALLVLGVFVLLESRRQYPMLDLSLFRSRVFSGSTVSAVLNYACVSGVVFVMPFLLMHGRGMSPAKVGLMLTAQPIVMAMAAPVSGTLSDRVGTRAPAVVGMVLLTLGLWLLATLVTRGSTASLAWSLALIGLGVGIFVSPNNSALMGAAPRHRQGIAAAVLATARNVGMVLGVGISGAVFTTVLAHAGPDPIAAGVRASLLTAAGIAVLGAITSAAR